MRGERSDPDFRYDGSNSNDPVPVASSQATAPAVIPHIFTNAVEIIIGSFRIDVLFAFRLYSLAHRMLEFCQLDWAQLLSYFEFPQKVKEVKYPQKLNENHQARVFAFLEETQRGSRHTGFLCQLTLGLVLPDARLTDELAKKLIHRPVAYGIPFYV
jgi:hypothetical protein